MYQGLQDVFSPTRTCPRSCPTTVTQSSSPQQFPLPWPLKSLYPESSSSCSTLSQQSFQHFPSSSEYLSRLFLSFLFIFIVFFFFATRPPTKRHANCWCNFPSREENVGGKWKENVFSWNILVSHIHIWSGKQWERRCLRKQDNELLRATHQIKEMQMLLGLGEDCKES